MSSTTVCPREVVEVQPDQGWQLQPGDQIKRSGLHAGYGASPSGRISGSASTPNIFLFNDPTNDHGSGPAEALGNDVVLFRGESGRDPHLHYANRAILDHVRDGVHIRMFRGQDGLVEYVGEVIPDPENPYHIESAPTPAGSRQQKLLVFHLRATENGSSALSPNQQGGAHPATVAEATMAAFGTAYYGTPARFDERGWELDGETDILCDACGQSLWALGKPWTSAVGVRYRFWAIACTTCRGVWDLDTYDDRTQELFRDWRRSIGKEPARVAVAPSKPRPTVPQHPPPPRPRYLRPADPPRQNLGSAKPVGSNAHLVGKATESLSPVNEAALDNWRRDGHRGVVSASGPDLLVIGLAAIKAVDSDKLNIVILVNRDARAIEWRKRLTEDLGIPADQVGALRNGVASLKVQRGVVAVASTAGGHLIQVITAWHEQGRRVLVIADGIRLSSYFFADVTKEIHAILILREDARGSDDVSAPVMIPNVIEPDRVTEIPAQEDIAVLGSVVGLFVDFTPLEKTMLASLHGNRKTPCDDPEPFTPNSYEWLKWRMRALPALGTKKLDTAVVDKHHLAEAASGRRRALNDVLDSIDLRKRGRRHPWIARVGGADRPGSPGSLDRCRIRSPQPDPICTGGNPS